MHQELEWIHHLSSAHQHWTLWFVWPQSNKPKASGWSLIDPSVAWIPLSPWVSITHSNGRRQTSGHSSYSCAYHKPGGEEEREKHTPGPSWLTGTTDPSILESYKSILFFPPTAGMGCFLNQAIVPQNTEYQWVQLIETYQEWQTWKKKISLYPLPLTVFFMHGHIEITSIYSIRKV